MHWRVVSGLLLAALGDASAQRGAITGTVHGDSLNSPLAGALVALPGLARETRTDNAGRFRLFGVPVGTWSIAVRRPGFTPLRDSVRVLHDTVVQHFVLRPLVVVLDSVTATSTRITSTTMQRFEQRRLTGMGTFVTGEQLRRSDDRKLPEIMRSVPGIRLINYHGRVFLASSRGASGSMMGASSAYQSAIQGDRRSPRACWIQVIMDGANLYSPGYALDVPDLASYAGRQFSGIEFYRSTAATPSEFNPAGATCGTLVLWSRQ